MAVHFVRYSIKIDSIRSRDVNPANARLLWGETDSKEHLLSSPFTDVSRIV